MLINSGILMESFQNLLVVLLCFSVDQTNSQGFFDCTYYGDPCNVSFMPPMVTFEPGCSCPENVSCSDPDQDRVLTFKLTYPEETITTTVSYCSRLSIPTRTCNTGTEIVATLFTLEPESLNDFQHVSCQCSKPLALVKTLKTTKFSSRLFSCGKPICDVCKSEPPACAIKTLLTENLGLDTNVTELPCRCPNGYSCDIDSYKRPPVGEGIKFFCKPTGNTTDVA